jgi:hypothetical protein
MVSLNIYAINNANLFSVKVKTAMPTETLVSVSLPLGSPSITTLLMTFTILRKESGYPSKP